MSKYIIFENKKGESLVYYPCAKNANSSAILFFLKHLGLEKKFYFLEDEIPRHKINQSLRDTLEPKTNYTIQPQDYDYKITISKNSVQKPSHTIF